ncbi:MAG TPA: hypothetical protein VLA12_02355, partial [Planctomycetaceae bacterium]|nr:hypothetical protein [Planctomycetaceae bacterium]
MNTTLVGRLFWKEYRFQRGLWLGIIAILLVIQLTMWGVMPPNQHNPLATLASIGVLLSAFYALGSAAVMFAGEREEGTDTWLRILPVTSLPVCGGKIAWMICSWAAAMGVGLLAAWLLTLQNPGEIKFEQQTLIASLTYGGLMPLWGILFSLVCRRVYIAIALAAGALLLTVFVNSYAPGFNYFALAALAVADVALGRRWLLTDGDFAFDRIGRTVRGFTLDDALERSVEPSLWWKFYRRELWLEVRQARWLFLGHLVFAFALLSLVTVMNAPEARQICWLVVFGLVPLQSGGMAFLGEQFRERFRFQTNQGVTPSALWCAKQTVWIGLTLLSIGLLFMFWLPDLINSGRYSDQYYHLHQNLPIPGAFLPSFLDDAMLGSPWPFVGVTLGIAGLMYSVGQLCSLLFRRSVTAGGIAFLGGAVLCGWLLTAVILNVPLTISVLFPCLAMLGLSLWRTSGWLTERNTVRDGVKIAGIVALLMFLSYQSWVIWRMLEVEAPRPLAELTALFPAVSALVYGVAVGFVLSPPGMLLLLVCLAAGWWRWGRSVRQRLTLRRVLVTYAALHL